MKRQIKFRAWDGNVMITPYCELMDGNRFRGEDLTNTGYNDPISVKLTKKQRANIYLKAAKNIFYGFKYPYACGQLKMFYPTFIYLNDVLFHYPEFALFEPTNELRDGLLAWWNSPTAREERVIALLLSHQMCKD
jgi:hypothetical protein